MALQMVRRRGAPRRLSISTTCVRLADRLFLKRWAEGCKRPRNASLAHLKLLVSTGQVGDERLLAWIENTLLNFGSSIERFISLDREIAPEDEEWAHGALVAELRNLEATYQPIIALSDHLLAAPDGVHFSAGNGYGAWVTYLRNHAKYSAGNSWTMGSVYSAQ